MIPLGQHPPYAWTEKNLVPPRLTAQRGRTVLTICARITIMILMGFGCIQNTEILETAVLTELVERNGKPKLKRALQVILRLMETEAEYEEL